MSKVSLTHVKWMCRRGMLELDFLLERFIERSYLSMDDSYRDLFLEMLNEDDPTLFSWLMGHQVPDQKFKQIVNDIRRY